MKPITILKNAKKLLSNRDKWCKGELAMDKDGYFVGPTCKSAKSFCAIGACCRVGHVDDWEDDKNVNAATGLLDKAAAKCSRSKHSLVSNYNDDPCRKHEQILKVFDKAIELASAARAAK